MSSVRAERLGKHGDFSIPILADDEEAFSKDSKIRSIVL